MSNIKQESLLFLKTYESSTKTPEPLSLVAVKMTYKPETPQGQSSVPNLTRGPSHLKTHLSAMEHKTYKLLKLILLLACTTLFFLQSYQEVYKYYKGITSATVRIEDTRKDEGMGIQTLSYA